jgi:hypothetical protein
MAQRKPVIIDGEFREVSSTDTLADVAGREVQTVLTADGAIIPRAEFAQWPVPDGFETNLTPQEKG